MLSLYDNLRQTAENHIPFVLQNTQSQPISDPGLMPPGVGPTGIPYPSVPPKHERYILKYTPIQDLEEIKPTSIAAMLADPQDVKLFCLHNVSLISFGPGDDASEHPQDFIQHKCPQCQPPQWRWLKDTAWPPTPECHHKAFRYRFLLNVLLKDSTGTVTAIMSSDLHKGGLFPVTPQDVCQSSICRDDMKRMLRRMITPPYLASDEHRVYIYTYIQPDMCIHTYTHPLKRRRYLLSGCTLERRPPRDTLAI